LGLSTAVHFHGTLPRQQLAAAYQSATVVVVPSRTEAQGVVVLEAMLSGTAIIASGTGGITDMLRHKNNALLIPVNDPAALATALNTLCTQPNYRIQLATQAQQDVQTFTWPPLLAQFEQLANHVARDAT